ncbi:PHC3 isoform 15 [Pongo abelii]|uniref:PHC3 isoform 15 n=1 Tax=Pongo abelii TaxID=9601 RepID=A0A2J8TIH6_PONAB|nr:PHC3 isoform 15 [Pongo abelii]
MAEAEFKDHSTAMDTEPNPGTSSVSTTTSSTTTTTITTSSSRMQQPQISVYSGSDRHAVQSPAGNSTGIASAPQLSCSVPSANVCSPTTALDAAYCSSSAAAFKQLPASEPCCRSGKFVQWKTIYISHRKCYTAVKYVPNVCKSLNFFFLDLKF